MIFTKRINYRHLFTHLVLWGLVFTSNYILYATISAGFNIYYFILALLGYVNCAFIFYTSIYLIYPRYLEKKKVFSFIILSIALFLASLFTMDLTITLYRKIPFKVILFDHMNTLSVLFFWIYFELYALAYWYTFVCIKKEKQLVLHQEAALRAEAQLFQDEEEQLRLENQSLRAQINPSFLIGSLEYLYSKIQDDNHEIAKGIKSLTNILYHATQQIDATALLIPLKEEIENIENLVYIYQLRYDNNIHVYIRHSGDPTGLRIPPHLLLTLVENAFKHGELHNLQYPLVITTAITADSITFSTENAKRIGPKELSHGIGTQYITRILEKVYPGKHTLHITDESTRYAVLLTIYL